MPQIAFATTSPFTLQDEERGRARPTTGRGHLFTPVAATLPKSRPALVILPGLGGIIPERELRYARMLADEGYVTLAVDTFAARGRDYAIHPRRALAVTETMMLSDAYSALRFLADMPMVDPTRVGVMGFSYGGMVSVLAAYEQMARLFAPDGLRFAAHASYYGASVPRFENPRTTGAPVEIFVGGLDRNVCIARSREIAQDLRRGGSEVGFNLYESAYHQWDSDNLEPKFVRFSLIGCRFRLDVANRLVDERTGIVIRGRTSRTLALALNASPTGYHMLRCEETCKRSDERLAGFLDRALAATPPIALGRRVGAAS